LKINNIMKSKGSFIILTIIFSFIQKTYAAYGFAKDGDLFVLALIGFLLLVAGFLFLIDFLRTNGPYLIGKLFHQF
jgi:hypothetical protein